ncbi:uncharacterized protein LOC103573631 isoform X2 [Microplitis demolitor]|uniref:uncharacterized protein LOC103573631 isoform X2 n=1 Tax=Microplitis demolitor TaxID=69319 RepID=UPI0004CCD0B1|nr:uncharacterized protein LOC103573631 isoform X2 [Microplitis demolitor]
MPLWMLPCTISSWVFTQYAMVLNFITQRFKSINKTILKIGKMDTESEPDTVLSKKITLSELIVNDIQIINYSDMKLCNICSETSDFYSLPALIAIIYFMAIAMFNLYYLFMAIVTNNFEEYTVLDAIESTATFLMTFNNFVALNTNVIRIKREFENTATNIHLLMDRCILNLEVKRVLSGFSWDLLHRNVRFSTYKIIEFDGSLLQSIFGPIVTNLIILIQFRPK